jgi:hypothetical protein
MSGAVQAKKKALDREAQRQVYRRKLLPQPIALALNCHGKHLSASRDSIKHNHLPLQHRPCPSSGEIVITRNRVITSNQL